MGENYTTFTGETISDFLQNNADYSDFAEALKTAGAFSLLESYGSYTCFVPNNTAMEAYAKEQGYGSFEHFLDSVEAVKEMVFYHLIDGEANEVGNYETAGFTSGAIDTKNMLGRYLYTSIVPDGTSWMINNSARIVSGDHIKVNGVVHIVDKALAGNTDLLADYIETEGHFKLYGEALHATGLRNSLTLLDDETYVPATTKPSDDPYASGAEFPKTKNYRYTALLETDSVLALNGIRTLDDMREYAKRFYPDGKDLPDTDEGSSLYRFVAYHLLPVMLASNQIVNTRDYVVTHTWIDADWLRENYRDGSFWLEQYLVPLAEQSIITVQAFKWGDQDAQKPVFNDERNCYDAQYTNMAEELDDVVTLDMAHSNLDCQNGVIHALTGMLVYDEMLSRTTDAFRKGDLHLAGKVEPLETVVDELVRAIKARHVARLQTGSCSIEYGFVLEDLLTNYERVCDHCSNVAVAQIEVAQDSFDTHAYLNDLRYGNETKESEQFQRRLDRYRERYLFPDSDTAPADAKEEPNK